MFCVVVQDESDHFVRFPGTIWYSLGFLGLLPMTWGWLIAVFFIMFEVFALAELSSAMPTAGGL